MAKTKVKMTELQRAALSIAAQGLPVFPTVDKMPAWSNDELGVKKGEGGYKIASTDPGRVAELFAHRRAAEVAVPMGEMSGLMCIDVDVYKSPEIKRWYTKHKRYFQHTMRHTTRSGGVHCFFKHPGATIRFPATLAEGVDVKANGAGYVCWPDGLNGYEVECGAEPQEFPMELLQSAMKAKGGTGSLSSLTGKQNSDSDDELVRRILEGEELYPALRSLSMRLLNRGEQPEQVVDALKSIMNDSQAADEWHNRHEDWVDRFGKIEELVGSAEVKAAEKPGEDPDDLAAMADALKDMEPLVQVSQRTLDRLVEAAVPLKKAVPVPGDLSWFDSQMTATDIAPRRWLVGTRLLQSQFAVLAGPGGTGKSSMVLATALAIATGDEITGEKIHVKGKTLIVNNEDPRSEIERRLVAVRNEAGLDGNLPLSHIAIQGAPERDGEEPLILAVKDQNGEVEIVEEAFEWLEKVIVDNDIVYCTLDPFISLIKGAVSNDNDAISAVAMRVRRIAFRTGCAIECVAHSKKADGRDAEHMAGDQAAVRGASALVDTARIVTTVMPMGPASAKEMLPKGATKRDIDNLRLRFLRMDTAKGNLARKEIGRWYEMLEHDLGQGDKVGVPVYIGDFTAVANIIKDESEEDQRRPLMTSQLIKYIGEGEHSLNAVFIDMKGKDGWPWAGPTKSNYEQFEEVFSTPCTVDTGRVELRTNANGKKRRLSLFIEENQ